MTTTERKIFNGHDYAKVHGNVWIGQTYGAMAYRDGKSCDWAVHPRKGKRFTEDPAENMTHAFHWKSGDVRVFPKFADAAEWCEARFGVTGWARFKDGSYHPSETEHDRPCEERVRSTMRATPGNVCDRKVKPGEEKCGLHLAADRRRAESNAKMRSDLDRANAEWRIAGDAVKALAAAGIDARQAGGGRVAIHAEDAMALARELTELREMRRYS